MSAIPGYSLSKASCHPVWPLVQASGTAATAAKEATSDEVASAATATAGCAEPGDLLVQAIGALATVAKAATAEALLRRPWRRRDALNREAGPP